MIVLRKINNKDGSASLMLDYRHDGKRMREYLKHLKLVKVNTPLDREENRQRQKLAEQIRNKRELELMSNEYQVVPDYKKDIDFVAFFENYLKIYTKKDKRVMTSCFGKFKEFIKETGIDAVSAKSVNEDLVIDFKDYLENNLNGETPSNYFKKFKRVLKHGVKEKIFLKNAAEDITIKRGNSIEKDVLTFEEISMLASTRCGNEQVKKAFLLSCLTGLRWCDVKSLKWKHIQSGQLKMKQQKTDLPVIVSLNRDALLLIGKAGNREEQVFTLPSHTAALKNLRNWCDEAKIKKHITWHCSRHSFGVNLIYYGSDVHTVSKLLGHSSLNYTQRYLREADALKERAVNNLPGINIPTESTESKQLQTV